MLDSPQISLQLDVFLLQSILFRARSLFASTAKVFHHPGTKVFRYPGLFHYLRQKMSSSLLYSSEMIASYLHRMSLYNAGTPPGLGRSSLCRRRPRRTTSRTADRRREEDKWERTRTCTPTTGTESGRGSASCGIPSSTRGPQRWRTT